MYCTTGYSVGHRMRPRYFGGFIVAGGSCQLEMTHALAGWARPAQLWWCRLICSRGTHTIESPGYSPGPPAVGN